MLLLYQNVIDYYASHDIVLLQMMSKVDDKEFSIEEMKTAADDIKNLCPIQEGILVALNLRVWKEIPDVLKSEVTASKLARFMVSSPLFTL